MTNYQKLLKSWLESQWNKFLESIAEPTWQDDLEKGVNHHSDDPHPSLRAHYPFVTPTANGVDKRISSVEVEFDAGYPDNKEISGSIFDSKETSQLIKLQNEFLVYRNCLVRVFSVAPFDAAEKDNIKDNIKAALQFMLQHCGKQPLNVNFDLEIIPLVYTAVLLRGMITPDFNSDELIEKFIAYNKNPNNKRKIDTSLLKLLSTAECKPEDLIITENVLLAANAGHPIAAYAMGNYYERIVTRQFIGYLPIPCTLQLARKGMRIFYEIAADNGYEPAKIQLAQIEAAAQASKAVRPAPSAPSAALIYAPSAPPPSLLFAPSAPLPPVEKSQDAIHAQIKDLDDKLQALLAAQHGSREHTTAILLTDICAITNFDFILAEEKDAVIIPAAIDQPITLELLNAHLALTPSCHIYEKNALTDWVNKHKTDPLLRKPLKLCDLNKCVFTADNVNLVMLNGLVQMHRDVYNSHADAHEAPVMGM